jgi:hypothetical protein
MAEPARQSINQHTQKTSLDWLYNILIQPSTGAGSGVAPAVHEQYSLSLDLLRQALVEVGNVVNVLTTEVPGKVLDARQGKALADAIALRELIANKVSAFQAEPDDTHYPTEKLVKDALDLLDERIDNILASSGTSDTEVVDARLSGSTGVLYTLLKNRLDAMEKYGSVLDEAGSPIATVMLRVVNGQPQLVTEEI